MARYVILFLFINFGVMLIRNFLCYNFFHSLQQRPPPDNLRSNKTIVLAEWQHQFLSLLWADA